MSLKDALTLKNHKVVVDGTEVLLRRPSVADLAEAHMQTKKPETFAAWLLVNHLLDENGNKFFSNIEEVYECDGRFAELICMEIDKLYGEGRD